MTLPSLILLLQCLSSRVVVHMDEQELRESLSLEELAERAITVPIKITDLDTLEKLIGLSKEFDKTFDKLALLGLGSL